MKNLDMLQQRRMEITQSLSDAIAKNDEAAVQQALESLSGFYSEMITGQINGVMEDVDRTILAGRGVRQLTSQETKYYQAVIGAMKASDPKQAIANIDVAFPQTVIDTVIEDIIAEFPLLNAVDFGDTATITKMIYNTQGVQKARWGALGLGKDGVSELTGSIAEIDLAFAKLYAYMVVNQDMLDAGPAWVDRYVRSILTEALGLGAEDGIVKGTGVSQPIGMITDGTTDPTTHEYNAQTATALTEITPTTIGALVGGMAVTRTGRPRKVNGLIFVCNPVDYYTKVMPATTVQGPDGVYHNDVFPVPCTIIQSTALDTGKAVFGIGKQYFYGMGLPKGGKLEYDDSTLFLEDKRAYKIKFIGNGMPKDFNSFKYLDISNLKPQYFRTKTVE